MLGAANAAASTASHLAYRHVVATRAARATLVHSRSSRNSNNGGGGTMRRGFSGVHGIIVGALVVAGACGSDKNSTTTPLVATTITASSVVNGQTGVVAMALAQPIAVQVLDQNGAPLNNAVVTWTVESGGGSVATPTTSTDASGNATVVWTLGTVAGLDSLKASIPSGAAAFITATATAGSPSAIQIKSGGTQTITAGS